MRIRNLSLTNYRCFDHWEQPFLPGFNVIIGDNGTGKTAVLDALKVSLGAFLAGFRSRKFEPIAQKDIRLITGGTEEQPTLEPVYPVRIETRGEVSGEALSWVREIKKGEGTQNSGRTGALRELAAKLENDVQEGKESTLPLIVYYPADRLWPRRLMILVRNASRDLGETPEKERGANGADPNGQPSRLDGYRSCLNAHASEEDVRRWIRRLELSALQRRKPNATLEAVKKAVADSLLEEWDRFYYDVLLEDLVVKNRQGKILPTRLLSHGQRNVLSMVADMAYRCSMLNPHLRDKAAAETPGVVLIDELDLHLHPTWQRRVIDDLRCAFPAIQFIATTHSPLIVQSLRSGELIDLGPERDEEPEKYVGKSPEDILEHVMEVPMPQRSEASLKRYETALEYYRLLKDAENADRDRLTEIKKRLDELMVPYYDNEAYAAYVSFLKEERIASGVDQR